MKNFGELKNTFSEILVESILRKDDKLKAIAKQYLKLVKENKAVRLQTMVYSNLEGISSKDDKYIDAYISENIKLLKSVTKHDKNEVNKKLTKILENKLVSKIKIDYPDNLKSLHNHIHNLDSPTFNVDSIIESRNGINGYIIENEEREAISESLVPTKLLTKITARKFNEKYQDLTEDEIKLVKTIQTSNTDEREVLLKEMVNECIELVNENVKTANDNVKEKLLNVKERLLENKFNEDTFTTDIIKLIDLKQSLIE